MPWNKSDFLKFNLMSTTEDTDSYYYLGVDIGGTKCSIVLGDNHFNILRKIQFETKVSRGYVFYVAVFNRLCPKN
jgi:predicted NBD/HSP70 family sugar kinase